MEAGRPEGDGDKSRGTNKWCCCLPDHLQRWQESLRVWVCMGWSLPLVETKNKNIHEITSTILKTKKPIKSIRDRHHKLNKERPYLEHDNTDLLDTLNNGLWGPCNGDGTLCWVGQHVPCYLYLSSCWLQRHQQTTRVTGRAGCRQELHDTMCIMINQSQYDSITIRCHTMHVAIFKIVEYWVKLSQFNSKFPFKFI